MIKKMIYFTILLFAISGPFVNSLKLHEQMTAEEVNEIFRTTKDSVPAYEVISVQHTINKRTANPVITAKFFNQTKKLYLQPTEGLLAGKNTKVWTAKSVSGKLKYTRITNALSDIGKLYQDRENQAAIRIRRDINGNLLFEGIIGQNHAIRPLPERHRRRRDLSNDTKTDNIVMITYDHIIFMIPHTLENNTNKFPNLQNLDEEFITKLTRSRSRRSTQEIVYPEILVFVDQKLFEILGKDVKKAVGYLASFYNGVDLRFRAIQKPKIRLNIAGFVLIEDISPFLASNIKSKHLIAGDSLFDFSKYLLKENQFKLKKDYDVILYMTGLDMVSKTNEGFSTGLAGLAIFEGACGGDNNGVQALTFFEDHGAFDGIPTGSHELAHTFGVPHDDMKDGPSECSWEEGYIMSYKGSNEKRLRFSRCSQEKMRNFLNSERTECLRNQPPKDQPLPKILPGRYMSLDQQCKSLVNTKSCNIGNICTSLFCQHPDEDKKNVCISSGPAAEGSPCGEKKYCLNGECIPESSNIVPGVITYY